MLPPHDHGHTVQFVSEVSFFFLGSFVKTREIVSTILKMFIVKGFYLLMIVPVQSFSLNELFCKNFFF